MRILAICLVLSVTTHIVAQKDTIPNPTKKTEKFLTKSILPVSLIVGGAFISNSNFDREFQEDARKGVGYNVNTRLDDYLRFGPMVQIGLANALNLKARNHWFDQAKNLFIIDLANFITVRSLKSLTEKGRPNNEYIYNSFPSGHTTLVFSNATMLYYEYVDNHPVFAYSGYAFAVATASLRVLNDRHWISDVLAGAGIGMLITHIVYAIEPLKKWNPFKKEKGISFAPMIGAEEIKVSLNWNF